MSFKENILKKIRIHQLQQRIAASLKVTDSGRHIDKDRMRELLSMIPAPAEKVRDLEIYSMPVPSDQADRFLVLDNELPIYQTDVNDIALRRSPTLKEMLNIRNAIKILNDKDVVLSKIHASLQWVVDHLISGLDLSYTADDIHAIADAGALAFKIQDPEGVEEALTIFAMLLELVPPPPNMRLARHTLWGRLSKDAGAAAYGPFVCYGAADQVLVMMLASIQQAGPGTNQEVREIVGGRRASDLNGPDVFAALAQWVLSGEPPKAK